VPAWVFFAVGLAGALLIILIYFRPDVDLSADEKQVKVLGASAEYILAMQDRRLDDMS
jgi:uncharacterized membrane protein YciS (DUF1049 family)